MPESPDVPQGTLALMVVKKCDLLWPPHGYGVAVNQGSWYPLLLKLEHAGANASDWGTSKNNRRARFFDVKGGDLS